MEKKKNEKGLRRRKEEESSKGGRNNEGLRLSVAHGSGGTSVPRASSQQLHTAQRVGAESRSQNRELQCRAGGPSPVGICKLFFFFFSLSSFIKVVCRLPRRRAYYPHVLPDSSRSRPRRPAGGAAASLMNPRARARAGRGLKFPACLPVPGRSPSVLL